MYKMIFTRLKSELKNPEVATMLNIKFEDQFVHVDLFIRDRLNAMPVY
jgi:hypothetical protein